MIAAVGVNAQNARPILRYDPCLLWRKGEFVHIGDVHDSRKSVRRSAGGYRIGKQALFHQFNVFLIKSFPLCVIGWVLTNASVAGPPVLWFNARCVEDRRTDHLPDATPIR